MEMTIMNRIEGATEDGKILSRDQGAERSRARASKLRMRILRKRWGGLEALDLSR